MKHSSQDGFTLIEVLLAIFLIAIILIPLMRSQIGLLNANSNSNLQVTQAAVVEAVSYRYGPQLGTPGFSVSGDPASDFASVRSSLKPSQQEILDSLSYSAKNEGGKAKIKVWIKNAPNDPRQIEVEVGR